MLETYKVGVTLEMTSNVSGVIDKVMRDIERFNRQVKETSRSLAGLRSDLKALGDAGSSIGKLSAAMDKLGSTKGIGSMVGDMDRMASATMDVTAAAERLGTVLRENARAAADTAKAMQSGARGTGGSGGRGGGPPAAGGRGIGGHDLMLTGLGASMVGAPVVSGVQNALERAFEVGHLRTQILADQRVSPAQADAAVNAAYAATTSAPGTRVSENLKALIDLKNVTGSLSEAETALPKFAQLSGLLGIMDRRSGGSGDPAYAAAKAMEIMGQMIEETTDPKTGRVSREINPAMLNSHLDMMSRVAVATNMRVSPKDYLGFAKQARVAGMMLSDEFTYEKLPAWLQTTGGPRVGTALMSMAQVFSGGKLTDKSYDAMAEIGLAGKAKEWMGVDPVSGRRKKMRSEPGVYDLDLMRSDPLKYMQAAQARMEAAGVHGTETQLTALMTASQRSTIAGALAELLKDMPSILKEQQNIRNTAPDAFSHFASQDPDAKLQQFQAAFDKLLVTLGSASMDDAVKIMSRATDGLNALSAWAKDNPLEARILTDVAAGLGAFAVALGTLSTAIFLFGPALKLLGLAGGGASVAGEAAATGGLALGGVLAGVVIGGAAAGYAGATRSGEDIANHAGAGQSPVMVDDFGNPIGFYSAASKPVASASPQMNLGTANNPIYTYEMNTRGVAAGVTSVQTRGLSAAPSGPIGPDTQMTAQPSAGRFSNQ